MDGVRNYQTAKINYRPEIDGLRAIAVVSVILYHAQITIFGHESFKGGFIGVDIFFVISGYLITSIILKELVTTGTFSFKHFYERRIRRILPVLLFVMLLSLPFAWGYFLPSDFVNFSKSILSSLVFSSNIYFHYSNTEYQALDSLLKPFLHTWSLSIEEQYYILFPIFLLITFKYLKKYLLNILVIGLIISLLMADWGSKNYPSITYYFLHTRMWELIAGSLLAYFEINLGHRSKNQTLSLFLPSLGLFLIVHSIFFFSGATFHPSFYTLSPIIGVCLIIWFSHKDELITKILSSKLFVGIGLISYSLYLWHYPIFAFFRYNKFILGNQISYLHFIVLILLIVLSIFSYFFIELPCRKKTFKFKKLATSVFLQFSLIFLLDYLIIFYKGFDKRFPNLLNNLARYDVMQDSKFCHNRENDFCIFGKKKKKTIFLLGDSHLDQLAYSLLIHEKIKNNYKTIDMTISGGLYLPEFEKIMKKTKRIIQKNFTQNRKKIIDKNPNSIIIFLFNYPRYIEETSANKQNDSFYKSSKKISLENGIKNTIMNLSQNNKIILIYPVPELNTHIPRKILQDTKKGIINENYFIYTSFNSFKKRTKLSTEILDSIVSERIFRIYPSSIFCDTFLKDKCVGNYKDQIFYIDDNHLTLDASEKIKDMIIKEIEKIETNSN